MKEEIRTERKERVRSEEMDLNKVESLQSEQQADLK
jgi:hypothetical protein